MIPALAAAAALLVGPMVGMVADPTEAEILAWLEREIERASEVALPAPFAVAWTYEDYNLLSSDDLAALRREVAGKPFHPRRPALEAAEQQIRLGKTLMHMFWLRDRSGQWRYGFEYPGAVVSDTVYSPTTSWELSKGTLALYDRKTVESGAEPMQNPKASESVFRPDLQAIFFGSLSAPRAFGIGVREIRVSGARWRALFAPAGSAGSVAPQIEFEGRWNDDLGRAFVERMTYRRHPMSEFEGHAEVYEDWTRLGGEAGPWAAMSVRRLDASGRTWRRITDVRPIELSEEALQAAIAVPRHGSQDPIRGAVSIQRVADFATGVVTEINADTGAAEHAGTIPGVAARQRWGWRTLLGWAVLAALAVFAVVLIAYRTAVSHRRPGAHE